MDTQVINSLRSKVASLEGSKPGTLKLAAAYKALGDKFQSQEDGDQARLYLEKALHIYQHKTRKSMKMAMVSCSLAELLFEQNEWVEGCILLRSALKIYERKIPMSIDLAEAYKLMGNALYVQEEFNEACLYCQKTLDIYRLKRPDSSETGYICYLLALVYLMQNNMEMAQQSFEQVLEHDPGSSDVADTSSNLANILYAMGQTDQAQKYYEKALAIVGERSNESYAAFIYCNFAEYMHKQGNLHREQHYYQKAVKIDERWNQTESHAVKNLVGLGLSLYANGELANARLQFERVISLYEEGGLQEEDKRPLFVALGSFLAANAYFGNGRVLDDEGEYMQSLLHYQKALDIYNTLGPKRLDMFRFINQRSWPTMNMIQQRIALHPSHLLKMEHSLLPSTLCNVFAKCGSNVQSIYYMLREQPHLVEVYATAQRRNVRLEGL